MSHYTAEEWKAKQREMREKYGPSGGGLKPKPPLTMLERAFPSITHSHEFEKMNHDRGHVSQLGGVAKPAQDRTAPLGARAGSIRDVVRDNIREIERMKPR